MAGFTLPHRSVEIVIYAGPDKEDIGLTVDRHTLTKASPWFEKALKDWNEGQTGTIHIQETEKKVVYLAMRFIKNGSRRLEMFDKDDEQENLRKATILWRLGDEYLLPRLQNQALEVLSSHLGKTPPPVSLLYETYENSAPKSPLRNWVLRQISEGLRQKTDPNNKSGKGYKPEDLEPLTGFDDFAMEMLGETAKLMTGYRNDHGVSLVPPIDQTNATVRLDSKPSADTSVEGFEWRRRASHRVTDRRPVYGRSLYESGYMRANPMPPPT